MTTNVSRLMSSWTKAQDIALVRYTISYFHLAESRTRASCQPCLFQYFTDDYTHRLVAQGLPWVSPICYGKESQHARRANVSKRFQLSLTQHISKFGGIDIATFILPSKSRTPDKRENRTQPSSRVNGSLYSLSTSLFFHSEHIYTFAHGLPDQTAQTPACREPLKSVKTTCRWKDTAWCSFMTGAPLR